MHDTICMSLLGSLPKLFGYVSLWAEANMHEVRTLLSLDAGIVPTLRSNGRVGCWAES